MKNFLSVVFILLFTTIYAQYPKLIVQFKDKGNNTFSLANPSVYLSARALQRRTKQSINIDSTDLPVTLRYIDSVRLAGNVTILSKSKWLNQVLIQTTDAAALAKIRNFPFVKVVQGIGLRTAPLPVRDKFNERIQPINTNDLTLQRTAADFYNYGNNYAQVHIHEGEFLHNKGYRGQNIQITVLDAGFQQYKTVTAFDSIRLNSQVIGERDFVAFDNSVNEDDSHGMYCLSTMSANWPGKMVGTAPKANYWLIRTENVSSEYPIEEHNWVAGAEFADSTGSDMISSSLGYYDFDDASFNHSYSDFYKNTTQVSTGATLAAKKGIIVMNSAGNEGGNAWKYIGFPADADSVCAVGAINTAGQIANFSSFGYPGKVKPNIVSVGSNTVIAGLNNQPQTGSGTSYANPNVAGLIACLWQAFPTLSNMKILDAVYKSSDKYNAPDNRFGFGVPNFRLAYLALKKEQNISLYGNEWLFATPNPFTSQVNVKLIGQVDGNIKIELLNSTNQLVATKSLSTEMNEVYDVSFSGLASVPGGSYNVRYTDSLKNRLLPLQKLAGGFDKDWIMVSPNPFRNSLSLSLKAQESGNVSLVLYDVKGSKVEAMNLSVNTGQVQTVAFKNIAKMQRGVYLLRYTGPTIKRTIRLLKH